MQMRKIVGLLVLVAGGIGLAISQYMSREEKSHTTDVAAGAFAAVADAANRMATDRTTYAVEVTARMGVGRVGDREEEMTVVAAIAVRGSANLSDICTSLPRVRDSVNAAVGDRIRLGLRDSAQIKPDELSVAARAVLASLNRLLQSGAVTAVRLSLKPTRETQDSGCNTKTKTASATHAE
jgi:hypothetical protein